MRKVQFNNKECIGEIVDFITTVPEQWVVVTALDGSVIKVKTHITELIKVKDEYYENGEPAYLFSWSMSTSVVGGPGTQKNEIVPKEKIQ